MSQFLLILFFWNLPFSHSLKAPSGTFPGTFADASDGVFPFNSPASTTAKRRQNPKRIRFGKFAEVCNGFVGKGADLRECRRGYNGDGADLRVVESYMGRSSIGTDVVS